MISGNAAALLQRLAEALDAPVFTSGNGQAVSATGTLAMNETGVNQDACQGATLTLHLTIN